MEHKQECSNFSCSVCTFTTTTSLALEIHLKTHIHEKSLYLCPQCDFSSVRPCRVVAHMKSHEKTKTSIKGDDALNDFIHENQGLDLDEIDLAGKKDANSMTPSRSRTRHSISTSSINRKAQIERAKSKKKKEKIDTDSIITDAASEKGKRIRLRNMGSLQCPVCEKYFLTAQTLKCHVRLHTLNKRKCSKCDFVCDKKKLMRLHMKIHDGKRYPCEYCSEVFTTRKWKLEHVKISHANVVLPFNCEACGYSCDNESSLKKHIQRSHTKKSNRKPQNMIHSCPYCSYSSYFSTNYLQHVRTHTGERPYKCSLCNYSAAQSSSLKSHLKSHSKSRAFKCIHCQASFIYSSNLSKHLKTHEDVKEYKCDICERSFTAKHNMDRHRSQHSIVHKCDICNKVFQYSNALKVHLKFHKPNIDTEINTTLKFDLANTEEKHNQIDTTSSYNDPVLMHTILNDSCSNKMFLDDAAKYSFSNPKLVDETTEAKHFGMLQDSYCIAATGLPQVSYSTDAVPQDDYTTAMFNTYENVNNKRVNIFDSFSDIIQNKTALSDITCLTLTESYNTCFDSSSQQPHLLNQIFNEMIMKQEPTKNEINHPNPENTICLAEKPIKDKMNKNILTVLNKIRSSKLKVVSKDALKSPKQMGEINSISESFSNHDCIDQNSLKSGKLLRKKIPLSETLNNDKQESVDQNSLKSGKLIENSLSKTLSNGRKDSIDRISLRSGKLMKKISISKTLSNDQQDSIDQNSLKSGKLVRKNISFSKTVSNAQQDSINLNSLRPRKLLRKRTFSNDQMSINQNSLRSRKLVKKALSTSNDKHDFIDQNSLNSRKNKKQARHVISRILASDQANSSNQLCCSICNLNFTSTKELKVHMKVHQELQSYTCVHCKEVFPFKATLKTHMKTAHNLMVKNRGRKKKNCSRNNLQKIKLIDQALCSVLVPLKQRLHSNLSSFSDEKRAFNNIEQDGGNGNDKAHSETLKIMDSTNDTNPPTFNMSCVELLKPYIKAYHEYKQT